jgi:4'-phosphopantetheinyl transferase EntD
LDRVLFSAKESLFKAWFPLAQDWLDFDQAHITLRPDGTFDASVTIRGPLRAARGRWLARGGLVITALALPVRN